MSPELTAVLAYYREWLKARKREQEAAGWVQVALARLTKEDRAEYERLIVRILAECEE